jgi:glutaminyl-peptide cyclotransferase
LSRLTVRALACAALAALALSAYAAAAPGRQEQGVQALRAQVVRTFPHDEHAFTEGLVLAGGRLFESTGLYGESDVREVRLRTGRVLRERPLPGDQFGEGLALVGKRLYLLTYREGVANVYDSATFRPVGIRRYRGEGWGLCYDGAQLVQSNGSSRLTFRDPATFRAARSVTVVVGGTAAARAGLPPGPVRNLNELECVGDRVYANVWQTDLVVEIDAGSGRVRSVIDASGLLTAAEREGADVLNGIAHVPERGTFLLTGKLWPRLFEVRFVPR